MSLTLGGLLGVIRERLPGATWTDANLLQWIADAIADYSIVFPRTEMVATIECVGSQREYDLSADLVNAHQVTRVEYPGGEDPPEYLERLSIRDKGFLGGACYDVWGDFPVTLWIGEEPGEGETIVITYQGDHFYPTDEDDVLTVPDGHIEGIVLFVVWKAAELLRAIESESPQTTTLLLTQFDMMVYRADRAYRTWMREVSRHRAESAIVSWEDVGL